MGIEELDDFFKEVELGHRVRDLAGPEGLQGAERKLGLGLVGRHGRQGSHGARGEGARGRGLDLDLGHFQGTQGNVGKELCRGRGRAPDQALVSLGVLLAGEGRVLVFEDLVQAVLEGALGRVAEEGGEPALPQGHGSLLSGNRLEASDQTSVLLGVDLSSSGVDFEHSLISH